MHANGAAVRAALRQARAGVRPCWRTTSATRHAKSGKDLRPSCTACRRPVWSHGLPSAADLEVHALQVRQESAAKLAAQAQEAAQREQRMAALQAQRQRPQSPSSPAAATPPPAARADKVNECHISLQPAADIRGGVCLSALAGLEHWLQAEPALSHRPFVQHASRSACCSVQDHCTASA